LIRGCGACPLPPHTFGNARELEHAAQRYSEAAQAATGVAERDHLIRRAALLRQRVRS
jgi:hypothetical protein